MAAPSMIGYALGKRKGKKKAMKGMAKERPTKRALDARRRMAMQEKYGNTKRQKETKAKFGKMAQETEKVPYSGFNNRMSAMMQTIMKRRNQGMM
jgi:hypothetical protein